MLRPDNVHHLKMLISKAVQDALWLTCVDGRESKELRHDIMRAVLTYISFAISNACIINLLQCKSCHSDNGKSGDFKVNL